jgi:hypothetical protein
MCDTNIVMNNVEPYRITFVNKKIYDFYASNPAIDIETINLLFIQILEHIGTDLSKMVSTTLQTEILTNIKDIKHSIQTLNDSLSVRLNEHNRDFLDNIKLLLSVSSNENIEKISTLLDRNVVTFMDKITTTLPSMNSKPIQEALDKFQKTIQETIQNFLYTQHDNKNLRDFMSNLEHKLQTSQQPIFAIIHSHQELVKGNIQSLKQDYNGLLESNSKLYGELNSFLSRYTSSSQFKGQVSELILEEIMNKLFPTGEVINSSNQVATGDVVLKRADKPTIILENKNYKRNVDVDEIKKFIRDISQQKCCGIMLSQNSGIVGKPDYFIEVHDGNVLIYLHNVNYSMDKIKNAVDIIDNLYEKLSHIKTQEHTKGITIHKECLDRINQQYQLFLAQKTSILNTVRETQRQLTSQIEELHIPELAVYLNDKYASIQNQEYVCDLCNMPFSTRRALASHKKSHKKTNVSSSVENIIIET